MIALLVLLVFTFTFAKNRAVEIDNGIKGVPIISCGTRKISITIETEDVFSGNLYVKGFYHNPSCRVKGNNINSSMTITIPVTFECGMRRRRVANPRGLILDTTIILMFHPIFLTNVDKAYHVQCHYMEADKEVTKTIDVSMRPATELHENQEQLDGKHDPVCQYEVLKGGPQGDPLKYATIGDVVYHKWSCEAPDKDLYCMTVHSCSADDGHGMGQKLVDEKGCSLDNFLLNNLKYSDDLTVGQEAHVFKFADRPTIFFSCMIRLELKEDPQEKCIHPPDFCPLAGHSSFPIETPNRLMGEIGKDFPRPRNMSKKEALHSHSPYYDSVDKMMDDSKNQNFISETMANRFIRDAKKIYMDIDVSAPSLDVVDLPSFEKEIPQQIQENKEPTQICVSRLSFGLIFCMMSALSILSVFLYCAIAKRLSRDQFLRKHSVSLRTVS